jgi:hypothetical protein
MLRTATSPKSKSEDNINGTVSSGKPTAFCTLTDDTVFTRRRDILILGMLIVFIFAWSVFLIHYPPEEIVGHLGVNNTYLLVFLLAAMRRVCVHFSVLYTALYSWEESNLYVSQFLQVSGLHWEISYSMLSVKKENNVFLQNMKTSRPFFTISQRCR